MGDRLQVLYFYTTRFYVKQVAQNTAASNDNHQFRFPYLIARVRLAIGML